MTTYTKFKALMQSLEYNYRGVELSHVTALRAWALARGENTFKLTHFFKMFLAMDVQNLNLPNQNGFMATFMENYRKDHFELFNNVVRNLSEAPSITNLFELKNKISWHLFKDLKIIFVVFRILKKTDLRMIEKIHYGIEYAYWINTIMELDKIDFSKVKKYLCMCHVLGMENLLTQYFRKKGIETFSLQEGIYLVYKKNKVLGSIAYELFETDHLLCWGQYTKDEYSAYGIDPRRISVAGYPKGETIKPQKEGNEFRNCLVLLAGPIFGDVNNKLLKILLGEKDHLKITLKPHPANYSEMSAFAVKNCFDITKKGMTVGECFESAKYDFCIAVNTTAYYESWMAGVPCVRYYDERFDNFYGFDDFFSDEEQFKTMINGYRICPKNENEVKEMLKYAIGFGLDNYDKVINGNLL